MDISAKILNHFNKLFPILRTAILHFMRMLILVISLLSTALIYGQAVEVEVVDALSGEPLIGANIVNDNIQEVTDEVGKATIVYQKIPFEVEVSYVGYATLLYTILEEGPFKIELTPMETILDIMTVTASKYEKRLSESTISVEVLKPDLIESVNTINIDAALEKVPGVQMIDGQANIRGGSGYSYGAGSRVMLLIDDMPALQVDAGFPNWGDIPVENIAQVEVLKGASSALYGSSALNGIIHIRTGSASAEPLTKMSAAYTTYGDAPNERAQWWGDTSRYQYTMSVLHQRKIGKLDLSLGGFHTRLESFNQFTYQNRKRLSAKMQYPLSDKAFLRVNTLINKGDNGSFFVWADDSTGLYKPAFGMPSSSESFRYLIDPSLHVEDSRGNSHKILTRYHNIDNGNSNGQGNTSVTYYGEYQFQTRLEDLGLVVTAGAVAQRSDTDAQLFSDTTFVTNNLAAYIQGDKKIGDKLNVSAGIRYEYNEQLTPESFNDITIPGGRLSEGRPVARLGLNYEYAPYSSLRASWGQGFRFPTITEKFIATSFAGFQLLPSPDLQSEYGWSAEIGWRQGLKVGKVTGYVDAAVFRSEYEQMTEFTFGRIPGVFGFSSENVGDTKITGVEVGIFSQVDLGSPKLNLYGGYTYIDPKYKGFEGDSLLQTGLSTNQNILKYRVAHNVKMDAQLNWKGWSLGSAYTYASHMVNIDKPLENLEFRGNSGNVVSLGDILGIKGFRDRNNSGYHRLDFRTSYTYKNYKLSLLINNALNEEYTVRPGLMEAPRNVSFRVDIKIR